MLTLEQFYTSVGSDAKDVIARLGGSPALVMRFLAKFPADKSLDDLKSALDRGDGGTAFRAAHTMKGVCATLGLQSLCTKSSEITEMLRNGGDIEPAKLALPALEAEYEKVMSGLKELGIE